MFRTLIIIASLFLFTIALSAAAAFAGVGACQPAFGTIQSCPKLEGLQVDVQVKHPSTGNYVDAIPADAAKFPTNGIIDYQISVRNTGPVAIKTIVVRAFLPKVTTFTAGPGVYDKNNNLLSYVIGEIKPGESQNQRIVARYIEQASSNCDVSATTNRIILSVDNRVVQDTTGLCTVPTVVPTVIPVPTALPVQAKTETKSGKTIFPAPNAQKTPKTGAETMALALLIPSGLLGTLLLRKTGGGASA